MTSSRENDEVVGNYLTIRYPTPSISPPRQPMPTLEFKGKQIVYAHHLTVPSRTLEIDAKKSLAPKGGKSDLDDNLIIHGDNLHALKALMPRYAGRVNCIYIDPPYNTGNEKWIYNDNVNSAMMKEWLKDKSPVDGEDLERHDKWLCMMWPRLHLLRELLAEDGVIFVSIDDNEQHRLRMVMDEIFGEGNFVESFIWRSRLGKGATSKKTATLHEFIISYAKTIDLLEFKEDKRISERESKERLRQWGQGDTREDRPTMYYPVLSAEFGKIYPKKPDGTDGRWRISKNKMSELVKNNLVMFEKQEDGRVELYKIIRAGTETRTAYSSILDSETVKTTAHGSIELKNIFDGNKFSYPKPSSLIKELISLCTKNKDIVLDSFAGSGTTAHAVLKLNKADNGNRKFILVECEDYANKTTAERVRRVIKGIPKSKDENLKQGLGGSFTYCTLGDEISVEKMLTGKKLPDYETLARYVAYTATGQSPDKIRKARGKDGFFYETKDRLFYLIYEPKLAFLRSTESALNSDRAERIAKQTKTKKKTAVVFATHKFMGQKELTDMGIVFAQLPYSVGQKG